MNSNQICHSPSYNQNHSSDYEAVLKQQLKQLQDLIWRNQLEEVENIVRKHPRILSQQNSVGYTPLHMAIKCTQTRYRSQLIINLIEEGVRHNVGGMGVNGRGGLYTKTKDKHRSALCLLVVGDDKVNILSYLTARQPPLLTPSDVMDQCLLHHASCDSFFFDERIGTVRFLINLCPRALACRNHLGDLPIHHACKQPGYSLKMIQILLMEGARRGVYLECDGSGTALLQAVIRDHIIDLLRDLEGDIPVLQGVIGIVPKMQLQQIIQEIDNFRGWCCIPDVNGRYPIHCAAECGLDWSIMEAIIHSNEYSGGVKDPILGLYPFISAAAADTGRGRRSKKNVAPEHEHDENHPDNDEVLDDDDADEGVNDDDCISTSCDLTTIFELTRMHPACITENFIIGQ